MPTDQTSGDTEFWTALGKRLREHRDAAGLSQEQVAAAIGHHRPVISDMERGRRKVYALELGKLARLYGTTAGMLLDGIGPETGNCDDGTARARALARIENARSGWQACADNNTAAGWPKHAHQVAMPRAFVAELDALRAILAGEPR